MDPVPEPTMADALTRQMAGQWQGLMSVMTKQGASRADILELSLSVAVVVLTSTADALWGSQRAHARGAAVIPAEEEDMAWRVIDIETRLLTALRSSKAPLGEKKEPGA